jgi:hypothetical protein
MRGLPTRAGRGRPLRHTDGLPVKSTKVLLQRLVIHLGISVQGGIASLFLVADRAAP